MTPLSDANLVNVRVWSFRSDGPLKSAAHVGTGSLAGSTTVNGSLVDSVDATEDTGSLHADVDVGKLYDEDGSFVGAYGAETHGTSAGRQRGRLT